MYASDGWLSTYAYGTPLETSKEFVSFFFFLHFFYLYFVFLFLEGNDTSRSRRTGVKRIDREPRTNLKGKSRVSPLSLSSLFPSLSLYLLFPLLFYETQFFFSFLSLTSEEFSNICFFLFHTSRFLFLFPLILRTYLLSTGACIHDLTHTHAHTHTRIRQTPTHRRDQFHKLSLPSSLDVIFLSKPLSLSPSLSRARAIQISRLHLFLSFILILSRFI